MKKRKYENYVNIGWETCEHKFENETKNARERMLRCFDNYRKVCDGKFDVSIELEGVSYAGNLKIIRRHCMKNRAITCSNFKKFYRLDGELSFLLGEDESTKPLDERLKNLHWGLV